MMMYLITFFVFLIVVGLMSVGVMLHQQAIQGSCGGLASLNIARECNCVEACEEHSSKLYQIQEPRK